jgi:hypothetical protein
MAYNGFFNIEVTPTLTGQNCVTAFGNGDVVADWIVKTVPTKRAFRIIGVTCVERGTNGANQVSNYELVFASPDSDGSAPSTLGTVNATANGTSFYKHLVGIYNVTATASALDVINVSSPDNTDGNQEDDLVIEPSRVVNTDGSISFDGVGSNGKICIGVLSTSGAPDFGTGVLLNQGENQGARTVSTDLTVDGVNAKNALAVGDVLRAQDNAEIGTITALAETTVTVDAVADALLDDDELVNINPLTFIIHCEY